MIRYTAFHGTLPDRAVPIAEQGVHPSTNGDDWLGHGTYFFIDGIQDARQSAIEWATCRAWDKGTHRALHQDVGVVTVEISASAETIMDLRDPAVAHEYHSLRRRWIENQSCRDTDPSARPHHRSFDPDFINQLKVDRELSVVISNFYIQLTACERHLKLDSRVPNVSVLCLSPNANQEPTARIVDSSLVARAAWACEQRS